MPENLPLFAGSPGSRPGKLRPAPDFRKAGWSRWHRPACRRTALARRVGEQLVLDALQLRQPVGVSRHFSSGCRRQVPLPLQGASSNTRSKRPLPQSGPPRRARWRSPRRPPAPRAPPAQSVRLIVEGQRSALVLHGRRQRQRLSPRPCRQIQHPHARLTSQSATAFCAAASWISKAPAAKRHGGQVRTGCAADGIGNRRRGSGTRTRRRAAADTTSRAAFSVLTRRSTGRAVLEKPAFPPAAGAPKARVSSVSSHCRIFALHPRRRVAAGGARWRRARHWSAAKGHSRRRNRLADLRLRPEAMRSPSARGPSLAMRCAKWACWRKMA